MLELPEAWEVFHVPLAVFCTHTAEMPRALCLTCWVALGKSGDFSVSLLSPSFSRDVSHSLELIVLRAGSFAR